LFNALAMRINLRILVYIFSIAILQSNLLMAQSQTGTAPTGSNVNTGGPAWANPGNITNSDNNRASASLISGQTSDALVANNFGFTIPTNATIDGITVNIERYGTRTTFFIFVSRAIRDQTIQLTKNGTTAVGANRALTTTNWPASDGTQSYGGAADLWGTTWTPAEINNSNFGVYIQAFSWKLGFVGNATLSAFVDHVTVTVDYTVPTPVELISFDGKIVEEVIELKWQTSWEKNNDFYTIEKSSNGLNYLELATVNGKGTTEFTSDYTYIDPLPFSGNNYYRLTQTDYDGTYEVFKPIMVHYEETGPIMKIYPNPVINQEVNLIVNPDLLKGENNNTYIVVRSITGEVIHQQRIPTDHLGEKVSLNKQFASGMYIVELHSPYGNTSEKLIVN